MRALLLVVVVVLVVRGLLHDTLKRWVGGRTACVDT